jgi:hypothetical protein
MTTKKSTYTYAIFTVGCIKCNININEENNYDC